MSDAAPRMYAWEVTAGACGASRGREQAMAVVGSELASAPPGTDAVIVEVCVSEYGVGYIPVRVVGRAERTEVGVIWTALAPAPAVAPETTSRPGLLRGAGRGVPAGE